MSFGVPPSDVKQYFASYLLFIQPQQSILIIVTPIPFFWNLTITCSPLRFRILTVAPLHYNDSQGFLVVSSFFLVSIRAGYQVIWLKLYSSTFRVFGLAP